ncbi:MAG: NAD(P)H-binding protein [Sulfurimonas sp.]
MKVLLTGANGYIGRRLKNLLKNQKDIELRVFVRNKNSFSEDKNKNIEIIEGDTFD